MAYETARHAKRFPRELGGAARYIYDTIKAAVAAWRKRHGTSW